MAHFMNYSPVYSLVSIGQINWNPLSLHIQSSVIFHIKCRLADHRIPRLIGFGRRV